MNNSKWTERSNRKQTFFEAFARTSPSLSLSIYIYIYIGVSMARKSPRKQNSILYLFLFFVLSPVGQILIGENAMKMLIRLIGVLFRLKRLFISFKGLKKNEELLFHVF